MISLKLLPNFTIPLSRLTIALITFLISTLLSPPVFSKHTPFESDVSPNTLEEVSIQLKWEHSFQFAGIYAAIEKGFYEEEGLKVTALEVDLSKPYVDQVVNGESEYGVSDHQLLAHYFIGKPIVLIDQIFQHSPLVFLSHRDSGIISPYQMLGKRLAYNHKLQNNLQLNALLANTFIDESQLNKIPFTSDTYQDFIDRKVDVVSAYSTSQPFLFKQMGVEVNIINPQNYGFDYYGDNLFTSREEADNHPDRVKRMSRATLKGWEYALKHPDEIIQIVQEKYTSSFSLEYLQYQAKTIHQMINPELIELGSIDPKRYEHSAGNHVKTGILESRPLDQDFFFYQTHQASIDPNKPFELTPSEKEWLKHHPSIRFTGYSNWLPYETFKTDGTYVGIVAEHLKLIEARLGIQLEKIPSTSASQSIQKIKNGEVDIISETSDAYLTPVLSFTDSYLESPIVFVMRDDEEYVENVDQIKDRNIAIIKYFGYTSKIQNKYSNIKFHQVNTLDDGLLDVSTGKIDVLLATLSQASYHISENNMNNLRIVGKTEFSTKLAFGMRPGFQPLVPLFNRAMKDISSAEMQSITEKWGKHKYGVKIDNTLVIEIAAFLSAIILVFIYWNRKLTREITLRETAEAQVQTIMDSVPLQILVTSHHGDILTANPQALSDYDVAAKDLPLLNVSSFYRNPSDRLIIKELVAKNGKVDQKTIDFKQPDGSIKPMMISVIPVIYNNLDAYLTIAVDIAAHLETQKALKLAKDQAQQTSRFKSEFLANMSHEIRTPMNAIVGLGHLLSRTSLTDKQGDYVTKIESSAQSLLGIIDDILDLSKIEVGQLKISHTNFNLEDVLSNLSTLLGSRVGNKHMEFVYQIDPSVPTHLNGDALRLSQILNNLIGNAIKFTEQGHVLLRIELAQANKPLKLKFVVEDTGIGIKPDKIEALFQPFTQADGSTTRNHGGTGLGLSICRQLCDLMEGSINATSELGKGSVFTVILPFEVNDMITLPKPDPDIYGMRVLLVDDSPIAQSALNEMLTSLTFDVDIASSGVEALNKITNNRFSYELVLLDWRMPQMDGNDVAQKIKSLPLEEAPLIIMMTSFGREAMEQNIDQTILDGFLVKPISPSQLLNSIIEAKAASKPSPTQSLPKNNLLKQYPPLQGNILLAEDNLINQLVAQELLEQMGLSVTTCENGAEALKEVQKDRPDLVLMDIQMPVMDGFEATQEIRKLSDMKNLPIIAMTANAMVGDKEQSLNAGMDAHITKPVNPAILYDTLHYWLHSHHQTRKIKIDSVISDLDWNANVPGLNLNNGLNNVVGNKTLYVKLLKQFLQDYRNITAKFENHINNNDVEAMRRTIHTLRGVAGTLGAIKLEYECSKMDKKLQKATKVTLLDFLPVNDALNVISNSLNKWL